MTAPEKIQSMHQDAIIWKAKHLYTAASDPHAHQDAITKIATMLHCIKKPHIQKGYMDMVKNALKLKNGSLKHELEAITKEKEQQAKKSTLWHDGEDEVETEGPKIPDWVNQEQQEEFLKNGYIAVNRKVNGKPMLGYYSFNSGGKIEITNFLVTPLFLVYAGLESRYLMQIDNGHRKSVLHVPSKIIPSTEQFMQYCVSEGNFVIFGNRTQWLRIASDLLQQFPRCIEIHSLGWQSFHFFAYVDRIYSPAQNKLHTLDQWGIYKQDGENYLVAASCEAYLQLQRTGDDPYQHIRYLTYKESPVNFETWAAQMHIVYRHVGPVAVAAAILCLFRDLVFDVDNNCPLIYFFGEPSSGKSKCAESIYALFFYRRPAWNLNSGTEFAFYSYLSTFTNTPAHLNEFEIEVIKPEWFQGLKGIYDGESRQRGKIGAKNAVEIQTVRSVPMLTGQKLVTADDNSIVTRSIIEAFSTQEYTEAEKKEYDKLKDWESQGLNSILVELLQHRPYMQQYYKENVNACLSDWRLHRSESRSINQRILLNYAQLATCYAMMATKFRMPITAEAFNNYCFGRATHWSRFIRSSDTLSEFWRMLQYLAEQGRIINGWDYKVEEVNQVKVRRSNGTEELVPMELTKVLFLRLNNVHTMFAKEYKQIHGKEVMNIENMMHYFQSRKYFIGQVRNKRFERITTETVERPAQHPGGQPHFEVVRTKDPKVTNCYAFIYDQLEISLETADGNADTMNYENDGKPKMFISFPSETTSDEPPF